MLISTQLSIELNRKDFLNSNYKRYCTQSIFKNTFHILKQLVNILI